MTLTLSVLDQSPVREGGTMDQALAETIALAKATDRLGYHRYWVAEHHNTRSFASSTPEVLMARLAAETDRIRIGSGGVMMTHYSPLKVAENFRMLEALAPGRIDLGIGRAPGGDAKTTAALQAGPQKFSLDAYPAQVRLCLEYMADKLGPEHPLHGIYANPTGAGLPECWMLGSSISSAHIAAVMGLPFSYAHFIEAQGGPDAMASYRMHFEPSDYCKEPKGSLGVFVLACDDEETAQREALTRNHWVLNFLKGQGGPFPSPQEAAQAQYSDQDRALLKGIEQRGIVGTPDQVKAGLEQLAAAYGVDELILVTITYDFETRLKSYELLAREFGIGT